MGKKHTKKVNPRRIPLAKREINKDQILEEATKDDLYHAWLLVFNALIEQEDITLDSIPELTESVNQYIKIPANYSEAKKEETARAEKIMGMTCPYHSMRLDKVNSAVELEAFKRKVCKVAIHTALCVLCLGLESTRKFSEEALRHIFFNVDLTLAEIEHGTTTYEELENRLTSSGLIVDREDDDLHHVQIEAPA